MHRASEELARWSVHWQAYVPDMPTRLDHAAHFPDCCDNTPRLHAAFAEHGRTTAERAHPEYAEALTAAAHARRQHDDAWRSYLDANGHYRDVLYRYGRLADVSDPAAALAEIARDLRVARNAVTDASKQVTGVLAEPALRAQPTERISAEREQWGADRQARHDALIGAAMRRADRMDEESHNPSYTHSMTPEVDHSPSISM